MSKDLRPWGFELDEYIHEGEPRRSAKAETWQIAIGLQGVDGSHVSEYLIGTAKKDIEGEIDVDAPTARRRIEAYYEERHRRGIYEAETEEADLVSQRASELLMDGGFPFSPLTLIAIHKRLFEGIVKDAGSLRTYNISRNEWVLNGESVRYAAHNMLWNGLKYDFEQEREFSYVNVPANEAIRHIARFISDLWQIHPFSEGNTRATVILSSSTSTQWDSTSITMNSRTTRGSFAMLW